MDTNLLDFLYATDNSIDTNSATSSGDTPSSNVDDNSSSNKDNSSDNKDNSSDAASNVKSFMELAGRSLINASAAKVGYNVATSKALASSPVAAKVALPAQARGGLQQQFLQRVLHTLVQK